MKIISCFKSNIFRFSFNILLALSYKCAISQTALPFKANTSGVDYSTPQAAINAEPAGGTVTCLPGLYSTSTYGKLMITKALTVKCDTGYAVFDGSTLGGGGSAIIGVNTGSFVKLIGLKAINNKVEWNYNAGIQTYATSNLMIERCFLEGNSNGLLTSNSDTGSVVIINTEFKDNGDYNGYTHNVYVGKLKSLTLIGCYSHMSFYTPPATPNRWKVSWGHLIKSRARKTIIKGCRITMEIGEPNRCIDLPSGGEVELIGNLIEFKTTQNNSSGQAISYGVEGSNGFSSGFEPSRIFSLKMYQNTIVNNIGPNAKLIWIRTDANGVPPLSNFDARDNIFCNFNQYIQTDGTYSFTPGQNTTGSSTSLLTNANTYNYMPLGPVIGSFYADISYLHSAKHIARIDSFRGAVPLSITTSQIKNQSISNLDINVFPNPSNGNFVVEASFEMSTKLQVFVKNSMGQILLQLDERIESNYFRKQINLEYFGKSIYFIEFKNGTKQKTEKVILY